MLVYNLSFKLEWAYFYLFILEESLIQDCFLFIEFIGFLNLNREKSDYIFDSESIYFFLVFKLQSNVSVSMLCLIKKMLTSEQQN